MESETSKVIPFIKTSRLIVDFTGVEAASSAVFGLVLALAMDAKPKGLATRVCSLSPVMRSAFEMLSEKELIEVFDNLRVACETSWEKKKKPLWWPFK